jgi:hypothetical protein
MASTRISRWKWHIKDGYYPFMRQAAVLAALEDAGGRIASAAGDGVVLSSESSSGKRATPRVAVYTDTPEAMADEARNRSLTRALDAGRG